MKERMSERILRQRGAEQPSRERGAAVFALEDAKRFLDATEHWFFDTCEAAGSVPPHALGHWMSAYRLYKKACLDDLRQTAALHRYDDALLRTGRELVFKHLDRVQGRFFDRLDEIEARLGQHSSLAERVRSPREEQHGFREEDLISPPQGRGSFARSVLALLAFGTATAGTVESTDDLIPPPAITRTADGMYIDAPIVSAPPERTIQDLIDHPSTIDTVEGPESHSPVRTSSTAGTQDRVESVGADTGDAEGGAALAETVEPDTLRGTTSDTPTLP